MITGRMKVKFRKIGLLGLAVLLSLAALGVGLAHWQETLTIETAVETGEWEVGGTCGFWKNWDSHNTYTWDKIRGWLLLIDNPSHWLVPDMDEDGIDINDMLAVFAAGEGGTAEEKFLAHYLATRLNVWAGTLSGDTVHVFSSYDPSTGDYPYGYLALSGQGFLPEIIDAIEDKYSEPEEDATPTDGEFEIMKNICDALNKLEI